MAQNFRRYRVTGVGLTPADIPDGSDFDSYDALVGIHMANTSANAITASAFMTSDTSAGDNIGADYNFVVTAAGGAFLLDAATKPAITIYKGFTYTFDVSDASNATHVLRFATQADAASSSQYTTGVTSSGTPGQAGATVTIVTTDVTPTTLYYYCTAHTGMGNSVTVSNVHYLLRNGSIPAGSALQVLDGGAKFVVMAGDRLFVESSVAGSLDVWVSAVDSISS